MLHAKTFACKIYLPTGHGMFCGAKKCKNSLLMQHGFHVGMRVRLHGLNARPLLNSRSGVIIGALREDNRRFPVQVGQEKILLRPDNLMPYIRCDWENAISEPDVIDLIAAIIVKHHASEGDGWAGEDLTQLGPAWKATAVCRDWLIAIRLALSRVHALRPVGVVEAFFKEEHLDWPDGYTTPIGTLRRVLELPDGRVCLQEENFHEHGGHDISVLDIIDPDTKLLQHRAPHELCVSPHEVGIPRWQTTGLKFEASTQEDGNGGTGECAEKVTGFLYDAHPIGAASDTEFLHVLCCAETSNDELGHPTQYEWRKLRLSDYHEVGRARLELEVNDTSEIAVCWDEHKQTPPNLLTLGDGKLFVLATELVPSLGPVGFEAAGLFVQAYSAADYSHLFMFKVISDTHPRLGIERPSLTSSASITASHHKLFVMFVYSEARNMAHFEIFNFAGARLDYHTGPGLVMSICVYSPDGNPFMRVCPGLAYAHEQLYFGDNSRRLHVVGIEYRGDCVGLRTYKQLLELQHRTS